MLPAPRAATATPVGALAPPFRPTGERPASAFDRWRWRLAGRRTAAWRLALGLALAAALALGAWLALHPRHAAPLYVAVPLPEVGAGRGLPGVELLTPAVRAALLRGLLSLDGVLPLAAEQVDPVAGSPVAVAKATAADEVVIAHLDCNPATCQIALSRVLGRNGTLLWTQSLEAPMGQPYLLAEAVAGHLRQGYPDRARRYEISPLEVSAADYAEYLRLQDEMLHRRLAVPLAALIARAQKLRQRAPRFLEAPLLEAALLQQRFNAERDRADLEAAAAALRDARALAPSDPRPLMALLDISLRGEQLGAAEEALRRLEDLLPGDPEVEIARARLLERHGDRNGALAQLRDAARRRPAWRSLSRLADMEIRLGEHAAARRHLEELLARFPGYYDAQSLLAQLELSYGSPERAVELYARLLQRDPRLGETINLGVAYLLLGRYELAEQRFRQALRLQPASSFAALNLADVVLLQGRRPEAETVYRTVIGLATRDPTAAGWQLVSQRAQALAHLGQRRQAVGEAQRVLQLAPGNSEAAYEVAVVYAVVGDEASALANAEAALAQGIEPRWFTLPWFDRLRAVPELRDQLAARGLRAGGKRAASPGPAAAASPPAAADRH